MPSQENVETSWKGIYKSRSRVNYENTLWMDETTQERILRQRNNKNLS